MSMPRMSLLVASLLWSFSASAQNQLPKVNVLGETDTSEMYRCNVSYRSSVAAIESALRYNRIAIGTDDEAVNQQAITAYVNHIVFPLTYESGAATGSCAASLRLDFRKYLWAVNPVTNRRHAGSFLFCEEGTLLTGPANSLQERINEKLRDFVNRCISRYEASIRE